MNDLPLRILALTLLAMTAFAANSVLCRLALASEAIDPASFTAVRLLAGALILRALLARRAIPQEGGDCISARRRWFEPLLLFIYAFAFSLAYRHLNAATGALVLFGAVQATMILGGLHRGERPSRLELTGLTLALAGIVALLLPGVSAPPLPAALLMGIAGGAWGLYSLHGKHSRHPLASTADNFRRASLLGLVPLAFPWPQIQISSTGLLLAAASGAVASGLGYVIWYAALRGLTATRAAAVQLSVPVITAGGGILVLEEPVTLRWMLCAAAVLGGIALTLVPRRTTP